MFGKAGNGHALVGSIYSEDEIWSCTTCGACEAECPLLIEYIDKIVDLRRGLIDDGNVPQSLQKPLKALESRGNPYGKMEKKRADWARAKDFQPACPVKRLDEELAPIRCTSSTASLHTTTACSRSPSDRANSQPCWRGFRDSGSGRKRQRPRSPALRRRDCSSWRFVTTTPRPSRNRGAVESSPRTRTPINALKHDYRDLPPVEHISQFIAREIRAGKLAVQIGG